MFGKKTKYPSTSFMPVEADPLQGSTGSDLLAPDAVKSALAEEPEKGIQNQEAEKSKTAEADLTASVSRNTIFTGNITSKDNIEVFGEVEGDITSPAVIKVYGKVTGDINAGTFVANNAAISGNIISEKSAVIGNDTDVKGDVKAAAVSICGNVHGSITASESVSISSAGKVYGDISTPVIEISKGAVVYGAMVMEQPKEKPALLKEPSKDKAKPKSNDAKKAEETVSGIQQADASSASKPDAASAASSAQMEPAKAVSH